MTQRLLLVALSLALGASAVRPQDSPAVVTFKERYDRFLGVLDQLGMRELSSFRQFYLENDPDAFYPPKGFLELGIPASYVMVYYVRIVDYKVVSVEIREITIFDSGFTVIYDEIEGKGRIDYYSLGLNKAKLEERLLESIKGRNITVKHQDDRYEREIILLIGYHQR